MTKKLYAFVFVFLIQIFAFGQKQSITYSFSPATFNEDQSVTLTVDGTSVNQTAWNTTNLYIWAWSFDTATGTQVDCPTNGSSFGNSNSANMMTYNAGTNKYTFTFVPTTFFGRTAINKMGFLIKNLAGTVQTPDYFQNIGAFQFTSQNPKKGSVTFVASGGTYPIQYKTSISANWVLKANGTVVDTKTATNNFFSVYSVTGDANMEIIATDPTDGSVLNSTFTFANTPVVQTAAIPAYIKQGINYNPADPTKVGLALYAPLKSYVHVIGSFNSWGVNSNYLMKRDTTNPDLYWLEITGLTPMQVYTFQYRTSDGVKVADPYSTLVLSPDDDPYISATTYPNKPVYPAGQQFDVSVIQTAKPAYNWQVTSFVKPAKQNLVVYEALVRDFTAEKDWQSMIDKLPYLKSLNINAVELMPIMEFDGNNSWGYNPSFHYALDKAYGTPEKFKEFIDKCHQNGIAIILDVALNHATGRSPIERMWMNDTSGTGYGPVASTNPYFNQIATHTYGVYYDLNHSNPATQYYVNRVLGQWINEYKIDGFRWDLTKGFTQNCTSTDETCTNAYQQDRVDVLKKYADYQWAYDPNSYIIFEHLGTDSEEQQWANYRISEGKGVMLWDNLTGAYGQNTMGYTTNSSISRAKYSAHSFNERRNMTYGESHDEERLMVKDLSFGATSGSYNVKNLATALERQKAYGAVFLTIPGPKMIWQFGELGYDFGINRCQDGTTNNNCRTDPKPVAFTLGYDTNSARKSVYDTWAKILQIKLANPVFDTTTFDINSGDLMPRIYIYKDTLPATSLKNVVILANFTLAAQNIIPDFPYTGNWYNLMDNTVKNYTSTTSPITLQPGEFRIFGNKPSQNLATDESNSTDNAVKIQLADNPVTNSAANVKLSNAKNGTISVYDLSGKLVQTFKVNPDNGMQSLRLNNLKSGMYLLQLKTENGNAVTKMIVK